MVSISLIGETIYSLTNPSNYPTKDLKDIIPLRSASVPESVREEAHKIGADFSSVQFLECAVNSKLTYEVNLNSFIEVECKCIWEVHLTGNCTFEWVETRFLQFEEVSDLKVFLDEKPWNYHLSEYEGEEYYTINGFNLTKIGDVKTFEIDFKVKRTPYPADFTRIPWLFNGKYAQFVNFPMTVTPVQVGNTSDLCKFKVNLGLPFRMILMDDQSGWMDAYVPPESEWVLTNQQYQPYMMFEYPIEQECEKDGNTYFFKTHFSEDNIANLPKIILVPDIKIPILLLLFLFSPFYIPFFDFLEQKSTKEKPENQESHSKTRRFGGFLLKICELYFGPLLFVVFLLVSKETIFEMFPYLTEVMNPASWMVFIYPIIFFLFFYKYKGKI